MWTLHQCCQSSSRTVITSIVFMILVTVTASSVIVSIIAVISATVAAMVTMHILLSHVLCRSRKVQW